MEKIIYICDMCAKEMRHQDLWVSFHGVDEEPEFELCPDCMETLMDIILEKRKEVGL
jgi:hypothetical protein